MIICIIKLNLYFFINYFKNLFNNYLIDIILILYNIFINAV